ncbi:hypothetical protein Tco_1542315, partial [Tanacetum coccineum]
MALIRLSSPAIRCIGPGPIRVYYEPSPFLVGGAYCCDLLLQSDTVALKMVSGLVENFTITTELLSNEHVRFQLNVGLDMMNLAVEALELGGPTWRERKHLQPSRRRKINRNVLPVTTNEAAKEFCCKTTLSTQDL